jgi:cardiolipin synthase
LVPEKNNIRLVQWASADPIEQILTRGVNVYLTPEPFDHTKLLLVDDDWCLVGSTNWDPRSLRLNFEFNKEFYDRELVRQLTGLVQEKVAKSRRKTLSDLRARSVFEKFRDGVARMGIPYL